MVRGRTYGILSATKHIVQGKKGQKSARRQSMVTASSYNKCTSSGQIALKLALSYKLSVLKQQFIHDRHKWKLFSQWELWLDDVACSIFSGDAKALDWKQNNKQNNSNSTYLKLHVHVPNKKKRSEYIVVHKYMKLKI